MSSSTFKDQLAGVLANTLVKTAAVDPVSKEEAKLLAEDEKRHKEQEAKNGLIVPALTGFMLGPVTGPILGGHLSNYYSKTQEERTRLLKNWGNLSGTQKLRFLLTGDPRPSATNVARFAGGAVGTATLGALLLAAASHPL